ncbi:MAG: tRNA-dihydrouridine synthase [Planctomycetaceae bacterium]|nr:tRNA-dihydrouridine synthase [Planctomycetaceae bacterium]
MSEPRCYDINASWLTNLQQAPRGDRVPPPRARSGAPWFWCHLPVASPLGISAGPLLNGDWVCHYASLGFDILVYKTVRSSARRCYELPNLVHVDTDALSTAGTRVSASTSPTDSWAVSFGMPSVSPDIWQADIQRTRARLPEGKRLIVSVVGTADPALTQPAAALQQLTDDFAATARMAAEAGADGIEANFSCPNVSTSDGQLFQNPAAAAQVAAAIRAAIGRTPLVLKIGHTTDHQHIRELIAAVAPSANGLAMTNSISAKVRGTDGRPLFDGQSRGICGDAIRTASIEQVRLFADIIQRTGIDLSIVGVGGISTSEHVTAYLQAGAQTVALATAAMLDPTVANRLMPAD